MPRGSGGTSSPCPATPASSSARCPSPTSIRSPAWPRRFRSSRRPAAAIPRSTVGTITEIYDYLRVLFARVGTGFCPNAAGRSRPRPSSRSSSTSPAFPQGTRMQLLAPVIQRQKGEYRDLFDDLRRQGFLRARVDGRVVQLTDNLRLDRQMRHTIEVVVDRLVAGEHLADAAGRFGRDGPQAVGRGRWSSRKSRAPRAAANERHAATSDAEEPAAVDRDALQLALRLHALRDQLRTAQPATLQLQQPAGHVPAMQRPGHAARLPARPADPRRQPFAVAGSDRGVGPDRQDRPLAAGTSIRASPTRSRRTSAFPRYAARNAVARIAGRGADSSSCRARAIGTSRSPGASRAASGSTAARSTA